MSQATGIEWTEATWNPVRGCSRVSEGCRNCYAEKVAARFSGPGQPYEGLAKRVGGEARWTGKVRAVESHLRDPLRWKKPRRIFVNSMSDLFHDELTDEQIDAVFAVMALARQHSFQVLTKRPERMRRYMMRLAVSIGPLEAAARALGYTFKFEGFSLLPWPIPNIWLGVSVENQETATERLPFLMTTPTVVRWISAEPLLGPIDLVATVGAIELARLGIQTDKRVTSISGRLPLDWIVVGGESGRGWRTMNVEWLTTIVDQCRQHEVPVFVKQDSQTRSGQQGAIPDRLWAMKEYPA